MLLPDGRRLGAHVALGGGMVKAIDRAAEIGAEAIQVFADNPTAWHRRTDPPRELPAFRERVTAYGIGPVAIHAAYLVNLAGPNEAFHRQSVEVLAGELRGAPAFGASYVNVHIGSHRGAGVAAGIARLAEGVVTALAEGPSGPDGPVLLLENSPGGGWGLGVTVEELAAIAEALATSGVPDRRVGFCLDVAHAWGAGYDLSEPEATDALLDGFDAAIGLGRLRLVHLNDSKSELGSRMDRHEHVGAGKIGVRGMRHLLTHPRLAHATYVIETPGMDEGYDAVNLERARRIARGLPLDPMPPEAFHLRGARSRTAPAPEPSELDDTVPEGIAPSAATTGPPPGRTEGA